MGDKAWKAAERRVARFLNGERNRMSGAVDQLTAGDVVHDTLYVEVKHRATLAAVTWFKEAEVHAEEEGKHPLLALHRKGDSDVYYVFREADAEVICCEILVELGWELE